MTRPKNSIADQLNAAQLAISNSLADPAIQTAVAAYGYSAEKLTAGRKLLADAMVAASAQTAASGAKQVATVDMDAAWRVAKVAYQDLAKVVRAIYVNDRPRLSTLGLTGSMPDDTYKFITAAYLLFDNAPALDGLTEYGYDAARLAAERAKVAAFEQANNRQEAAKGAAQKATMRQSDAIQCINDWTARYIKIARVALREDAQLLEKLGVVARTSKTAAQRAASAKAAVTKKTGQG